MPVCGKAASFWRKPFLLEGAGLPARQRRDREAEKGRRYPAANFSSASSEPSEARESTT